MQCVYFPFLLIPSVGRDCSVGTATSYRIDGPGIESRWGARLSAAVQIGSGAHPAPSTTDTGSLSRGLSGRGVASATDPHLAPRLRKEYSYTCNPPLGLRGLLFGELHLHFTDIFSNSTWLTGHVALGHRSTSVIFAVVLPYSGSNTFLLDLNTNSVKIREITQKHRYLAPFGNGLRQTISYMSLKAVVSQ